MEKTIIDEDPQKLLGRFLEICNMSMETNKDRFPYCHIWRAAEAKTDTKCCEFVLIDDRPKALCHISLIDGTIKEVDTAEDADTSPVLKIKMSYLQDVVKSPEKYIEDPSLINWDWMQLVNK